MKRVATPLALVLSMLVVAAALFWLRRGAAPEDDAGVAAPRIEAPAEPVEHEGRDAAPLRLSQEPVAGAAGATEATAVGLRLVSSLGVALERILVQDVAGDRRVERPDPSGFVPLAAHRFPLSVLAPGHVPRAIPAPPAHPAHPTEVVTLDPDDLLSIEAGPAWEPLRIEVMPAFGEVGAARNADCVAVFRDRPRGIHVATTVEEFRAQWRHASLTIVVRSPAGHGMTITRALRHGSRDVLSLPPIAAAAAAPVAVALRFTGDVSPAALVRARLVSLQSPHSERTAYDWGSGLLEGIRVDETVEASVQAAAAEDSASPVVTFPRAPLGERYGVWVTIDAPRQVGRVFFDHGGALQSLELRPPTELAGTLVASGEGPNARIAEAYVDLRFGEGEAPAWDAARERIPVDPAGGFRLWAPRTLDLAEASPWPPESSARIRVVVPGFEPWSAELEVAHWGKNELGTIALRRRAPDVIVLGEGGLAADAARWARVEVRSAGRHALFLAEDVAPLGQDLGVFLVKAEDAETFRGVDAATGGDLETANSVFDEVAQVLLVTPGPEPRLLERVAGRRFRPVATDRFELLLRGRTSRPAADWTYGWQAGAWRWVAGTFSWTATSTPARVVLEAPNGASFFAIQDVALNPGRT